MPSFIERACMAVSRANHHTWGALSLLWVALVGLLYLHLGIGLLLGLYNDSSRLWVTIFALTITPMMAVQWAWAWGDFFRVFMRRLNRIPRPGPLTVADTMEEVRNAPADATFTFHDMDEGKVLRELTKDQALAYLDEQKKENQS